MFKHLHLAHEFRSHDLLGKQYKFRHPDQLNVKNMQKSSKITFLDQNFGGSICLSNFGIRDKKLVLSVATVMYLNAN